MNWPIPAWIEWTLKCQSSKQHLHRAQRRLNDPFSPTQMIAMDFWARHPALGNLSIGSTRPLSKVFAFILSLCWCLVWMGSNWTSWYWKDLPGCWRGYDHWGHRLASQMHLDPSSSDDYYQSHPQSHLRFSRGRYHFDPSTQPHN